MSGAARRIYPYPAADSAEAVFTIRGAYVHEHPDGPAVFFALDGVWYDCAAPCAPRFHVRGDLVYEYPGTGKPKYVMGRSRPARRGTA